MIIDWNKIWHKYGIFLEAFIFIVLAKVSSHAIGYEVSDFGLSIGLAVFVYLNLYKKFFENDLTK